jgi:cell division protein FtsW (lipid II flippase)
MSYRKKEEYLKVLEEQIRCKKARSQVVEEIRGHMEEQEAFYLSEGLTQEEAEEETVKEMGDPVEAGAALDLVHRPRMTWGFIGLTGALYIAGFAVLKLLQQNFSGTDFITGDYVKWLMIGLVILIGVCYVDYSQIGYWAKEFTAGLFILLLLGNVFCSVQVNGSMQWILLPVLGVSVNMRLLCFLFVPLYGAVLYHYQGQGYKAIGKGVLWMFPALFIAIRMPSVFTALELFLIFLIILSFAVWQGWFAVSKVRVLGTLWGGTALLMGAVFLRVFLFGADYHRQRLQVILGQEESYYRSTLRKIYSGCQMFGSGEGVQSVEGIRALEGMEFGLVYITAYFGIVVAAAIMCVLIGLVFYFIGMSAGQKNRMGMMMGIGCCSVFLVQILFYVLGNVGILPFANMYCPFLTYGGTGILVTNVLLGILISIYRYQDVPLEMKKRRFKLELSMKRVY